MCRGGEGVCTVSVHQGRVLRGSVPASTFFSNSCLGALPKLCAALNDGNVKPKMGVKMDSSETRDFMFTSIKSYTMANDSFIKNTYKWRSSLYLSVKWFCSSQVKFCAKRFVSFGFVEEPRRDDHAQFLPRVPERFSGGFWTPWAAPSGSGCVFTASSGHKKCLMDLLIKHFGPDNLVFMS